MASKRFEVVRAGRVGEHLPGERFEADPDDPTVQLWVASGAVREVAVQSVVLKASGSKVADKR